jgi:hypothetical protein
MPWVQKVGQGIYAEFLDSLVSIAACYALEFPGLIPKRKIHTDSWSPPSSFAESKEGQWRENAHSLPFSAEVSNGEVMSPLRHASAWHSDHLIRHRQFLLYPYLTKIIWQSEVDGTDWGSNQAVNFLRFLITESFLEAIQSLIQTIAHSCPLSADRRRQIIHIFHVSRLRMYGALPPCP